MRIRQLRSESRLVKFNKESSCSQISVLANIDMVLDAIPLLGDKLVQCIDKPF